MYFIEDHFGKVIFLFIFAIVTFIVFGILADIQRKEAFMEECRQYKKNFECVYMWNSSQPEVVPVFIPMSTGR